jgi:hypothetical protein
VFSSAELSQLANAFTRTAHRRMWDTAISQRWKINPIERPE